MSIDLNLEIPAKAKVLFGDQRYTVLHGGRGSGKSHSVAYYLLLVAAQEPKRILCCREIQKSLQASVHQLLADCIKEMGLSAFYQVLEKEIRGINGSLFLFSGLSAGTAESIKSLEGISIVWVEEAQKVVEESWVALIPTIRDAGSRIILTMNPMLETDATSQRFLVHPPADCVVQKMNWRDNPFFEQTTLPAERLHDKEHYPDTYEHIWEGAHLPAVQGAIFFGEIQSAESAGRLREVPYDPLLKVHTFWDLGRADSTAIIMVQVVGSEIRVFDFIEDNNKALSYYVEELKERRYNWGDDYIPHDGFHRRLETGRSTADLLQGFGRSVQRTPDVGVLTGIQTAREVFPRVYFDKTRSATLVTHLKNYRWDVPAGDKDATRPRHDEHSHAADAFRYLCVSAHLLSNEGWGQKIDYPSLVAA
jgi:phage terminase large subunit